MPEMSELILMQHFPIYQYFRYDHLPDHLQETSKMFHDIALSMMKRHLIRTQANQAFSKAEVEAGLRKLLEAKDCFVRAALPAPIL